MLDADSRALLDQYFPDHNLSIILKVAFENGYAKTLIPLLDRIYFSQTFSIPTIVVEAAQVLAHAICDNRYCAVFHAVNMVDLGLDPKEVKALIERQQLPSRYSDLKRWEKSLQLIAVQFHSPATANTLFSQLARFHEGQELADLGALIAFCNLDRFILEFFSEEIDLHAEPMIVERASYSDDLVLSFTEIRGEEKPLSPCARSARPFRPRTNGSLSRRLFQRFRAMRSSLTGTVLLVLNRLSPQRDCVNRLLFNPLLVLILAQRRHLENLPAIVLGIFVPRWRVLGFQSLDFTNHCPRHFGSFPYQRTGT